MAHFPFRFLNRHRYKENVENLIFVNKAFDLCSPAPVHTQVAVHVYNEERTLRR
jgi:hypothetical protein